MASDTIGLDANGQTLDLVGPGYTINPASGVSDESLTATDSTVNGTSFYNSNLFGNGDTLNLSSYGGSGVGILGTGNTVNASGDFFPIYDSNTSNTINGSSDAIPLYGSYDTVNATGSGDAVDAATGDNNETLYLNNGTVDGDNLWDTNLIGNGDALNLGNYDGSGVGILGTGDTVNATGDSFVDGMSGTTDTFNGDANTLNLYYGGETVNVDEPGGQANGETIYANGDTVDSNGIVGSNVFGSYNTANLAGTGNGVGFTGVGDQVNAQDSFVNDGASSITVSGPGDTIAEVGSNQTTTLTSGGDTVYADSAGLTGEVFDASGDTLDVPLSSEVFGNSDTINMNSNTGSVLVLDGVGETVVSDGNSTSLIGQGSSMTLEGYSAVNIESSDETVTLTGYESAYIANGVTGDVIYATDSTVYEGYNDTVDVIGSTGVTVDGNSTDDNEGDGDGGDDGGSYGGSYGGSSFSFSDYASVGKALAQKVSNAPFTSTVPYTSATGSNGVTSTSGDHVSSAVSTTATGSDPTTSPGLAQAQLAAQSTQLAGAATTAVFEGEIWRTPAALAAGSPTVITWSFATSPGTAADPFSAYIGAQYQATIEQAFQAWAAASGITFEEVPDSAASDIRIGWGDFDTSLSGLLGYTSFQSSGGVIQPGAIIRLEDPTQNALVAGADGQSSYLGTQATLYQVVLHEIGHALGLADDADPNSVMFTASSTSNQTLDQTDIAGIQALYGAPATAAAQAAVIGATTSSAGASAAPLASAASATDTTGVNQMIQAMASFTPGQTSATLAAATGQNAALEQYLAAPLH